MSSDSNNPASLLPVSDGAARFLHRSIVFSPPARAVHPPSWLEHIPFAFWLVDALRPSAFVELGTHSGNSYAAFAQAIQTLGLQCAAYAVDTWQGDPQAGFYPEGVFEEWSRYHDQHFSAFSRLVRSTFNQAAEHFPDGSVDLLHIDGLHTYEAVSEDFARWRQKLSTRGVVVLHDINVRERDFGVWQLWEDLRRQFPSFSFLHGHGLGIVGVGADLPPAVRWLLAAMPDADVAAVRQYFAQVGGTVSARYALQQLEDRIRLADGRPPNAPARPVNDVLEALRAAPAVAEAHVAELQAQLHDAEQRGAALLQQREDAAALGTQLLAAENSAREAEARLGAADERHSATLGEHARLVAEFEERVGELQQAFVLMAEHHDAPHDVAGRARGLARAADAVATLTASIGRPPLRRASRSLRPMLAFPAALGLLPGGGRRLSLSALSLLARPTALRDAWLVSSSGLFDADYYLANNPDVAASRMSPLVHFVRKGAAEDRNPHPLFDVAYYLRCNPDVAAVNVNPLVHYRTRGAFESRSPHPSFDVPYYLHHSPDVHAARVEPLGHFLRTGAAEGRNPNGLFDCNYYLTHSPDVAGSGTNPLVHFALTGWREGRRPSEAFDPAFYLSQYSDVAQSGAEPLAHYLEFGRREGRRAVDDAPSIPEAVPVAAAPTSVVTLRARALAPTHDPQPTIVCLTHVLPLRPRAGNEYRIHRMLRWFRDQGYRVIPVVAPLPGDVVEAEAVQALADEFKNAVLCGRDGRVDYVLGDVPDVLASLSGRTTRPYSLLLGHSEAIGPHAPHLREIDRVFCHDTVIAATLRLDHALGSYVLLAEYIWMSRVLPLLSGNVVKVVDTIDVFSTKRDKVLQFGIDDLHVPPDEEARRLKDADLIVAIQDEERRELQRLMPGKRVVTAGVDFDVSVSTGDPVGRRVLLVASDNPMNAKGLRDFLRFAWPSILESVPDAELLVAGRVGATLTSVPPGVVLLGLVDDLTGLYDQARVVINPAVAGTGLKIKTLESLGRHRTVVTWPSGTDGLAPELAGLCVIVRDWFDFARQVSRLLAADVPLLTAAQRDTLVRLTSPAQAYRAMTEAIEELRGATPRERALVGRRHS